MYPRQSPALTPGSTERCPVCYLYLLPNMTLESHLDTHPKDQVIRAFAKCLEHNRFRSVSRSQSPYTQQPSNNYSSSWISQRVASPNPHSNSRWIASATPPTTTWPATTYRSHSPSNNWSTHIETSNSRWQNHRSVDLCANNIVEQNYSSGNFVSNIDQRTLPCSESMKSGSSTIATTALTTSKRVHIQVLGNVPVYNDTNTFITPDLGITHSSHNIRVEKSPSRLNNSNHLDVINNQSNYSHNYVINDNSDLRTVNLDDIKPLSLICRKPAVQENAMEIESLTIMPESNRIQNSSNIDVNDETIGKSHVDANNSEQDVSDPLMEVPSCQKSSKPQNITSELIKSPVNPENSSTLPSSSSKGRKFINKSKFVKKTVKKLKIKLRTDSKNTYILPTNTYDEDDNENENENSDVTKNYLVQNIQSSPQDDQQNQQCSDDFYNIEQRTNVFSPNLVFTDMQDSNTHLDNGKDILNLDEFKKKLEEENRYNEFDQNVEQQTTEFPNFDEQNYNFVQNQNESTIKIIAVDTIDNLDNNELQPMHNFCETHSDGTYQQDIHPFENLKPLDDCPAENTIPEIKIISVQSIGEFNSNPAVNQSGKDYNVALDYTYQFPSFGNDLDHETVNNDEFRQNLDHSSSFESLNIRTDEKMPPRGELSEQESTDSSTWAFQNTGPSLFTNMPMSANEINISHFLSPILEPSSSSLNYMDPEQQKPVVRIKEGYKCLYCDEEFLCAKERRVHVSREHPGQKNISHLKKSSSETLRKKGQLKIDKSVLAERVPKTVQLVNSTLTNDGTEIKPLNLENFVSGSDYSNLYGIISGTNSFENKPDVKDIKPIIERSSSSALIRKRIRRLYQCNICKENFKPVTKFEAHLRLHPLECVICGKIFHKKKGFDTHMLGHAGLKKSFFCSFCSKRFTTKQNKIEHENTHNNTLPLPCDMCDKKFKRVSNLSQHRKFVHLKLKRPTRAFFCFCGENFPSIAKLRYHKETHDPKPKNCQYCSQKFIHAISLSRHLRVTHNDKMVEDTVPCVICSKNITRTAFKMHVKSHNPSETFSCYICNKTFSTKWNLKQHKFIHQNRGSKPYKCHMCSAAFLRETEYKSHINSHRKIYSYVCNFCGRRFIRKYNYLRHVKEHTTEKKYACTRPECGKTFHRKYYLTEHIRTHTGVRPYVCTICSKSSTTKSNHNKHLKIHHATNRDAISLEN